MAFVHYQPSYQITRLFRMTHFPPFFHSLDLSLEKKMRILHLSSSHWFISSFFQFHPHFIHISMRISMLAAIKFTPGKGICSKLLCFFLMAFLALLFWEFAHFCILTPNSDTSPLNFLGLALLAFDSLILNSFYTHMAHTKDFLPRIYKTEFNLRNE